MLFKMHGEHCYIIYEQHSDEESTTRNIICYCPTESTALDVQTMLNMYLSSELAGEKVGDPIWKAIAPMCDSESEFIYEKVDRFAATY